MKSTSTNGCGDWGTDAFGQPEFRVNLLTCPDDAWYLVGSPGLLALAHVSGAISLYATAGGMTRLADRTFGCPIDDADAVLKSVVFGVDRCTWMWNTPSLRVQRTLIADPCKAVLYLEWTFNEDREHLSHQVVTEHLDVVSYPLVAAPLMSRRVAVPSTQIGFDRLMWRVLFTGSDVARRISDRVRTHLGARHQLHASVANDGHAITWKPDCARTKPTRPRLWNDVPPTFCLTIDPGESSVEITAAIDAVHFRLTNNAEARLAGRLVLEDPLLGDVTLPPHVPAQDIDCNVPKPLAAEARWHVAQLHALRVPDPFVGHTFVMQGSAYGFVHGLHGALRDEAFVVAALAPIAPDTARDCLLAMTSLARGDGSFHYAHTGYGAALSGGIHAASSDLGLFYLWALTSYVQTTGDFDVCATQVRLRGKPNTYLSVGEVALRAARALDTQIGLGPHGMLRVGSGDWADPISLMVGRRRAFHHHGESTFNTAMAVAVLPDAATLLDSLDHNVAQRCTQLVGFLDRTLEGAWTGRWYLRGWDGRGNPIGEDHLFLDAQVWALIARHGSDERCRALVATIGQLLDDPSPIGPTILDRPHKVRLGMLADGWDCNGGVWAALGGLTAWAYSLFDPDRAWQTLLKQSLAHRRVAYPEVWYGQWSGPDAFNSHFAENPGETFVQPATPMTEFPVMNSNMHAGALIGLHAAMAATTV